jgi:hypothetical protein
VDQRVLFLLEAAGTLRIVPGRRLGELLADVFQPRSIRLPCFRIEGRTDPPEGVARHDVGFG